MIFTGDHNPALTADADPRDRWSTLIAETARLHAQIEDGKEAADASASEILCDALAFLASILGQFPPPEAGSRDPEGRAVHDMANALFRLLDDAATKYARELVMTQQFLDQTRSLIEHHWELRGIRGISPAPRGERAVARAAIPKEKFTP